MLWFVLDQLSNVLYGSYQKEKQYLSSCNMGNEGSTVFELDPYLGVKVKISQFEFDYFIFILSHELPDLNTTSNHVPL